MVTKDILFAHAEVSQFDVAVLVQHYIVRLQIPVQQSRVNSSALETNGRPHTLMPMISGCSFYRSAFVIIVCSFV